LLGSEKKEGFWLESFSFSIYLCVSVAFDFYLRKLLFYFSFLVECFSSAAVAATEYPRSETEEKCRV